MDSPNFNLGLDLENSPQASSNHSQQETQPEAQPQNNPNDHVITEICCVGAGRLGVISMLVMADRCSNVFITVVDKDAAKIAAWNHPEVLPGGVLKFPIYEPGLQELYEQVRATNRIVFSTNFDDSVFNADIIFIAVGITSLSKPAKEKGRMEVAQWDDVCRILNDVVELEDKIIVTLSTVPLKFKSLLGKIFFDNLGELKFLLNPSFLREGTAIDDTRSPPQVLIAYDPYLNQVIMDDLGVDVIRNLYLHWVPPEKIHVVNGFDSATLGKLIINVSIGTQISMMNSISIVCNSDSSENANIDVVSGILSRDRHRVDVFNPQPSVGFGGSGLPKDISYLSYVASSSNLCEAADFFKGIMKVNEGVRKIFVNTMHLKMNSLRGKKIAILGFTYKSNTENINNSPAIGICQEILKEEGAAEVRIFDPQAKAADIKQCFGRSESDRVNVRPSANSACFGVDAIVVLTDWPEFLTLNYTQIHANMTVASSKDIFIGRDIDDFPDLTNIGFRVHHIYRRKTMKT